MMAYSEDYIDDDFLQDVLCEDCSRSFPMYLLIDHQCIPPIPSPPPDNNNEEPTVEEIEAALLHAAITDLDNEKEESDPVINQNIINIADKPAKQRPAYIPNEAISTNKKEKKSPKKMKHEHNDSEVIDEHLLQEDETTFRFGLSPNTDKKTEEEMPSYRIPQIPILEESEKRHIIQNELPDSDNEETESLEDFWKRAEIKLQQRMRTLDRRSMIVDM